MIKPVAKFNINKVFNISSLLRHKKDVNQLPKLDKPIVAYMSGMFLEPERDDFTNPLALLNFLKFSLGFVKKETYILTNE